MPINIKQSIKVKYCFYLITGRLLLCYKSLLWGTECSLGWPQASWPTSKKNGRIILARCLHIGVTLVVMRFSTSSFSLAACIYRCIYMQGKNLIFDCINTSYPMDNCFTGRRDRSCQTPEKTSCI